MAALVGGRLLYVVQNELGSLADHPAHILMVWMGGLSFYGGLIGAIVALVVFARRRGISLLVALDVAAPAAAIGQAIGHVGCLIGGDSYGIPTDLPWAVIYRNPAAMAPQNVPLHPTQAYEAILLGLLFVGLWLGRERLTRLGDGAVAGAYLLGLAVIRFGLFYLRDEPAVLFGLKTAQLIGLGIAVLAIVAVHRRAPNARHPPPRSSWRPADHDRSCSRSRRTSKRTPPAPAATAARDDDRSSTEVAAARPGGRRSSRPGSSSPASCPLSTVLYAGSVRRHDPDARWAATAGMAATAATAAMRPRRTSGRSAEDLSRAHLALSLRVRLDCTSSMSEPRRLDTASETDDHDQHSSHGCH